MIGLDTSEADAKNAKLLLKLAAKNGYRADATYQAVSANQWARILAIAEDGERAKVMAVADELLAALEWLHAGEGKPVDPASIIARAKGESA